VSEPDSAGQRAARGEQQQTLNSLRLGEAANSKRTIGRLRLPARKVLSVDIRFYTLADIVAAHASHTT
jgi:hypothetical protein